MIQWFKKKNIDFIEEIESFVLYFPTIWISLIAFLWCCLTQVSLTLYFLKLIAKSRHLIRFEFDFFGQGYFIDPDLFLIESILRTTLRIKNREEKKIIIQNSTKQNDPFSVLHVPLRYTYFYAQE